MSKALFLEWGFRNFHYRDRFTFLRLYKQYVRPHLEFSAPAWSPWLQGDKDTLEKVQEKAVKMVAASRGPDTLKSAPSWAWTPWRRGDRTKTWPWCTSSSPSPVQQDKQCSTYSREPGQDRPREDTAWQSKCQNRHQEIFIRSEISGVLEQTTRDSENSGEWRVLQEKAQRKTRMTCPSGDRVMELSKQYNQSEHTEQ